MGMQRTERIEGFIREIWRWYDRHKRVLPWRDMECMNEDERAYRVLVSEVMLQQTQVSRTKVIFRTFLEQFPSIDVLAAASNKDVLLMWRGMGYNNRALRLRDAAKVIIEQYNGVFPRGMKELQALPGLGHYTAAAVRNFAFDLPTPCLDTNIRRILHRVFVGPERQDGTWLKNDRYLLSIAEQALVVALSSSGRTAADWHAALMDYGSIVCTRRNPQWGVCPLTRAGLMKAAYRTPSIIKARRRCEPGRAMAGRFIPNRIFRGKIVEELRDAPAGLALNELGSRVSIDWSPREHCAWLRSILSSLIADRLLMERRGKYVLCE